jgi:hypothetical protein
VEDLAGLAIGQHLMWLRIKEQGELTLQEQEPGEQVHEVQEQEELPQPPILIGIVV